jgi:hypothetical protein
MHLGAHARQSDAADAQAAHERRQQEAHRNVVEPMASCSIWYQTTSYISAAQPLPKNKISRTGRNGEADDSSGRFSASGAGRGCDIRGTRAVYEYPTHASTMTKGALGLDRTVLGPAASGAAPPAAAGLHPMHTGESPAARLRAGLAPLRGPRQAPVHDGGKPSRTAPVPPPPRARHAWALDRLLEGGSIASAKILHHRADILVRGAAQMGGFAARGVHQVALAAGDGIALISRLIPSSARRRQPLRPRAPDEWPPRNPKTKLATQTRWNGTYAPLNFYDNPMILPVSVSTSIS